MLQHAIMVLVMPGNAGKVWMCFVQSWKRQVMEAELHVRCHSELTLEVHRIWLC